MQTCIAVSQGDLGFLAHTLLAHVYKWPSLETLLVAMACLRTWVCLINGGYICHVLLTTTVSSLQLHLGVSNLPETNAMERDH